MRPSDPPVRVHVAPVAPVLHRGLARAAVAAGFTVVADADEADVTLQVGRQQDGQRTGRHVALDVVVGRDEILLRVFRAPDQRMASMLQVLLSELLDHQPQ